jgi:DNA-binding XRE family transcriptional regulator
MSCLGVEQTLRGSELREWRKILGYTQEQAGKALGVTRATIQNWEYESSSIPVAVQLACRVLVRRWKQRPEFGPVTVAYTGIPLSLAAQAQDETLTCERYSNNRDAFSRLINLKNSAAIFNPIILDDAGCAVWSGEALMKECEKYRDG